jgi:hypothetical protein
VSLPLQLVFLAFANQAITRRDSICCDTTKEPRYTQPRNTNCMGRLSTVTFLHHPAWYRTFKPTVRSPVVLSLPLQLVFRDTAFVTLISIL